MNIHVRQAEPGDIEILVKFLHLLFTIEKDFTLDADKHRAGLHLLLENHYRGTIFVAETDVMLVGMVTGQIVVSTAGGGYSILLEDMYIASGFRRIGIGSKLLKEVLAWGSERGALRVQLVADVENAGALMFYRQMGLLTSRMTALYGKLEAGSLNLI